MILIHTALQWEAQPIIDQLGLTRDPLFKSSRVFSRGQITLLVGGPGRTRALTALESFASERRRLRPPGEITAALNIGTCGAGKVFPVGSLYFINEVTDTASQIKYRLSVLPESGVGEAKLLTFDNPVTSAGSASSEVNLVDMEGAAFLAAANKFWPGARLFMLKTVSDHLEKVNFTKELVYKLISQNWNEIGRIIKSIPG